MVELCTGPPGGEHEPTEMGDFGYCFQCPTCAACRFKGPPESYADILRSDAENPHRQKPPTEGEVYNFDLGSLPRWKPN